MGDICWSPWIFLKGCVKICCLCAYQAESLCSIGSGAVESAIKQIDLRLKLTGAQWKAANVNQMLQLRCAYLNGQLAV
jgi:hypothetical protein